jgi:hypothetical protein
MFESKKENNKEKKKKKKVDLKITHFDFIPKSQRQAINQILQKIKHLLINKTVLSHYERNEKGIQFAGAGVSIKYQKQKQ